MSDHERFHIWKLSMYGISTYIYLKIGLFFGAFENSSLGEGDQPCRHAWCPLVATKISGGGAFCWWFQWLILVVLDVLGMFWKMSEDDSRSAYFQACDDFGWMLVTIGYDEVFQSQYSENWRRKPFFTLEGFYMQAHHIAPLDTQPGGCQLGNHE